MNDPERKEIVIDPAMFSLSNNKSKKKRDHAVPKIKVKGQKPEKKNNASTLKRNLLRMIRGHQEKRMKEQSKPPQQQLDAPPKSDFEQSISFLSQLNKSSMDEGQGPKTLKHNNNTLRQRQPLQPPPSFNTSHSLQLQPINDIPMTNTTPATYNIKKPYGCLKNGSLPTYRVWKNQTQRQNSSKHEIPRSVIQNTPTQMSYESQLRDKIKEMSEIEQHQKLKQRQRIWKKPKRQKRILRRTFRIGKSKAYPTISVLVSNKTMRNETNLRQTVLKETPISEVKQYLKKQGFIKVGTNTPNDVLREMYESASMICGELKNYSPENLLYNYFNTEHM